MKTLISQTIFSCRARASSSYAPTLSCHCFLYYSSSTRESQKRRDEISQHSSSTSSSWKHQDQQSRNVKVSVWWDFENCSVPSDTNVFRVTQRITSALRANRIKGPITITAFGDVIRLWRSNQEALYSTGVCLKHIPFGGKNCADSLLIDLVYWVSQNPPPAHLFLISGDRDFANVLHRLRMSNYNILLSSTDPAPGVLCNAASIVWQWNSLVRGEDLTGKHFNQPPDGPFGSWYGYHKGPLEDPFSDLEQQTCSGPQESPEAGTESTICPLPQALLSRIYQILNSNPEGIPIETLRAEILKNNLTMDKDFFGYKKFSRLLLSISTVSKLQPAGDGQLLVHGIHPNSAEPVESKSKMSMGLEINDADIDQAAAVDQKGGHSAEVSDMEGKASSVAATASPKFEGLPPACQAENNVTSNINPTSLEKEGLASELGIFSGICSTWFGLKKDSWNEKRDNVPQKSSTSDCSKKTKSEEKALESLICSASSCSPSSIVTILAQDENATKDSGVGGEKSGPGAGLFNKVMDWCRFWRTSGNPDKDECGKCSEELEKRKELFSQDSFWAELDLFINTAKGSSLVFLSKSRQMAKKLQKEGPMVLHNVSENDLLQLVDLLIFTKKWVEEHPSQNYPFKVIRHRSSGSNGLSSFPGKLSLPQPKLQGLPEQGMEKMDQNQLQPTASLTESSKKPSGTRKARHEILADCQKFVTEILVEYPEGLNMGFFKKLFAERYGYDLDHQMLGYSKLSALLQVMPEVKTESCYILPAKKASKYRSGHHQISFQHGE